NVARDAEDGSRARVSFRLGGAEWGDSGGRESGCPALARDKLTSDGLPRDTRTLTEVAVLLVLIDQRKPRFDPGTAKQILLILDDDQLLVAAVQPHVGFDTHVR